jgi:hypothetical protein
LWKNRSATTGCAKTPSQSANSILEDWVTLITKKARDAPPQETRAVIIAAIAASDLSAVFLGKQHVYTAGEAIVWAAALGPACAARAALVARPLTPPGGLCSAICRIVESSKAKFKFDDVTVTMLFTHPLFSGCTNWPRLEKG